MTIKLYVDMYSQPSRAIVAFCKNAKIPCEVVHISIMSSEHHNDFFKKINPDRRVPAMFDTEHNFPLSESTTIFRYLCNKFLKPNNLFYPRDSPQYQAEIDNELTYYHANYR